MVVNRVAPSRWALCIVKVLAFPVVWPLSQVAAKIFPPLWMGRPPLPTFIVDLGRFTRGTAFRDRQATASAWLDRHFGLIEQGAPWLDRAGAEVRDYCTAGAGNTFTAGWVRGHKFPATPSVACYRRVTAVYGFDGSLSARLPELADALFAAGWGEQSEPFKQRGRWTYTKVALQGLPGAGGRRNASWGPVPGLERPPGMEIVPWNPRHRELLPYLVICWAGRGGPGIPGGLSAGHFGPVREDRVASPFYRPVEISDEDTGALQTRALAAHQHAVAIVVELDYYVNLNANERPHRLRKRLIPVRA